jgi:glycosyltransferase involved in cell wall biosynthesis
MQTESVDIPQSSQGADKGRRPADAGQRAARGGSNATLIVNADDWGRCAETTDRILDCIQHGAVSSTSAMVFMEDSDRAASLAREHHVDAGLHLNVTSPFSKSCCSARLADHQQRLCRFLKSNRLAPAVYHPGLASSFEYVVKTQLEEFERLYGTRPSRVDGHHHMHLSANVLFQRLLPPGIILRRNLSFGIGEKGPFNRIYRFMQDRLLSWQHPMADFFFDIAPLEQSRLRKIIKLAHRYNAELETHPSNLDEYRFLLDGGIQRYGADVAVARGYFLRSSRALANHALMNDTTDKSTGGAPVPVVDNYSQDSGPAPSIPHICVCICTYKRAVPLGRLLEQLNQQSTAGLFSYSIVVADNDATMSAEATVAKFLLSASVTVKYCSEPRRGIALARNKVIANSSGDFVALIDDDELPTSEWLLTLFRACKRYNIDGVLGPVKRRFEQAPPSWLEESAICDRPVNPTGTQVDWREARTGNVLLKRELVAGDTVPFRPEFRTGEDRDFFRRKIDEGRVFVWAAEAEVFEVIPPARWKRMYHVKKALLQGAGAALYSNCNARSILKSVIAVPIYAVLLPLALLAGQRHFMTILVKFCSHAGKLLFLMKINPIREEYVSD